MWLRALQHFKRFQDTKRPLVTLGETGVRSAGKRTPNVVAEKAIALSKCDALRPSLISRSLALVARENPPSWRIHRLVSPCSGRSASERTALRWFLETSR
jgi:hypothetical protein